MKQVTVSVDDYAEVGRMGAFPKMNDVALTKGSIGGNVLGFEQASISIVVEFDGSLKDSKVVDLNGAERWLAPVSALFRIVVH